MEELVIQKIKKQLNPILVAEAKAIIPGTVIKVNGLTFITSGKPFKQMSNIVVCVKSDNTTNKTIIVQTLVTKDNQVKYQII